MKMTRRIAVLVCAVAVCGGAAYAADYIGEGKCKICHKVQHASWSEMAHAKAFERLKPEEQSNPECLKCHATGESAEMPGVQCEACHGPGSEYKSMKVMKDHDAAMGAGLVMPDEALCKSCHENAPHEVPAFDFATAKEKGIHAHKE